MKAAEFQRKFLAFRCELRPWTIFYLVTAAIWGATAAFLRSALSYSLTGRLLFLLLAFGTLLPVIVGAVHTFRLQTRHGLRCPFCGHGLGGSDGKMAMLTGKCPDCEKNIIEATF